MKTESTLKFNFDTNLESQPLLRNFIYKNHRESNNIHRRRLQAQLKKRGNKSSLEQFLCLLHCVANVPYHTLGKCNNQCLANQG